jgi:hypothetical protein
MFSSDGRGRKTSRDEELIAISFVEQFLASVGAIQRYAPESTMVSEALDELYKRLVRALSDDEELILSEFHNHLVINEDPVTVETQGTAMAGAFVFFMLERNLQTIAFRRACSRRELEKFLLLLAAWPDEARSDPEAHIRKRAIDGVRIEPQGKGDSKAVASASVPDDDLVVPEKITSPAEPSSDGQGDENAVIPPSFGGDQWSEDQPTRIMSQAMAPSSINRVPHKGGKISPTRKTGPVQLQVMCRLGALNLDGARVTILADPRVEKSTERQEGVQFSLMAGKYRVRVAYDKYLHYYEVDLDNSDAKVVMEVDLQGFFDK